MESWSITNQNNLGTVKLTKGVSNEFEWSGCIVSCLGDPIWVPLNELTTDGWIKMRSGLIDLLSDPKRTNNMFIDMYQLISPTDKKQFLIKYADTPFAKECCSVCSTHDTCLKKCIYSDCSGLCSTCFTEQDTSIGVCIACEREQKLKCPICLDDKFTFDMTESVGCSHRVCWKCYGCAFQAKKPIYKCPLCRAPFTELEICTLQSLTPPPTQHSIVRRVQRIPTSPPHTGELEVPV